MTGRDRLVPVGRVGRPHGVDGAFVVDGASEDPTRFEVGATLLIAGRPATVVLSRRVGGGRTAIRLDVPAERGAELAVPLSTLPEPPPDTYYVFQLVGLAVEDDAGLPLGRVADVHPGVANDNLELEDGSLVPLVEDAVLDLDLDAGRVVVARAFLGPPVRGDRPPP